MTVQPDREGAWQTWKRAGGHPREALDQAVQTACKPLTDEIDRLNEEIGGFEGDALVQRDAARLALVKLNDRYAAALDAIANQIGHPAKLAGRPYNQGAERIMTDSMMREIARIAHMREVT